MSWLQRIFRRRRLYDDLAEEVRQHIEAKTEQLMRTENLSRAEAEQAARRAFGNLTLVEERSREVWHDDSLSSERMFAQASTFFGVLALLLAAVGLYGTLAYSVARRQREMGIRLALGAQRGGLLRLVLTQGLRLVLLGIVAGWIASALAGRLLASMIANVLFHVHALDAFSFIGAAIILTMLGSAAALIPARRAASIDPMQALRTE